MKSIKYIKYYNLLSFLRLLRSLINQVYDLLDLAKLRRFTYHEIHPRILRLLDVIWLDLPCYRTYKWSCYISISVELKNLYCSIIPIKHRHIAVHKYDLIRDLILTLLALNPLFDLIDSFKPIERNSYFRYLLTHTRHFNQNPNGIHIEFEVIHNENLRQLRLIIFR